MKRMLMVAMAALALAACGGSAGSQQPRSAGGQPATSTSGRHVPFTLTIPALGVSATVEEVGVDRDGNMAIPADPHDVGWYGPGAAPGERGNAVIDGHRDWYGMPHGPFSRLDALQAGDEIDVTALDGTTLGFTVAGPVTAVPANAKPPGLFGTSGSPTLTLITCGGQWDASKHTYTERELLHATFAPERAPRS